jgi:hypothetical protein
VIDTPGGWATVSSDGDESRLALAPVAEACTSTHRRAWRAVLRRELAVAAAARASVASTSVGELGRLRPSLRVRVAASFEPAPGAAPPFALAVAGDLVALLAVDLPAARWYVPRVVVRRWNVDEVDLVRDAARRSVRLAWGGQPSLDPVEATVLTTPSRYGAALLVDPAVLLPSDGDGWLVAAPTERTVVVRPLHGGDPDDVERLRVVIAGLHERGPYPLSPVVHVWRPGSDVRSLGP